MIGPSNKRISIFMGSLLLFLGFRLSTEAVEAKSPQPQEGTPAYAYVLDCEGNYLKVDVSTAQTLAQGVFGENPSGENLRPPAWSLRFDGCFLTQEIQHDPSAGLVYGVVLKRGSPRNFQIAALRLPDLTLVNKMELPVVPNFSPRILLTPDSTEMLIRYSFDDVSGQDLVRIVSGRYTVPDFNLLGKVLDETFAPGSPDFKGGLTSGDRFWAPGGRIVDGNKIFDENGKFLERISAYSFLPAPLRRAMKHLERMGSKGKGHLSIRFVGSAADRMLFLVRDDKKDDTQRPGCGLLVYDVGLGRIVSGILSPYSASGGAYGLTKPNVHLTPDGEYIVLEQYEWREYSPEDTETNLYRFKTGDIHVYSVDTRELLFSVKLEGGRVIGFSSDGQVMIYESGNNLYVVRLTENPSFKVLSLPENFDSQRVIFSNK